MVLEDNLYQMKSLYRAERYFNVIRRRLESLPLPLVEAMCNGDLAQSKQILIIAIMRTDLLFAEFLYEVYRTELILGSPELEDMKINLFFDEKARQSEVIKQWKDTTVAHGSCCVRRKCKDQRVTKTMKEVVRMSEDNQYLEVVKTTQDGQWRMLEYKNRYFFTKVNESENELLLTPKGKKVYTAYEKLADRILSDLGEFGYDYHSSESILSWHFTMIDNFAQMEHERVESVLEQSFLRQSEWTFSDFFADDQWIAIFGERNSRVKAIRNWLSKCTHMQMTAACCIGNAYYSINLAYVFASMLEQYSGALLDQKFTNLAELIDKNTIYGPVEALLRDFDTFKLYYGIHLEEKGSIIPIDKAEKDPDDGVVGKKLLRGALIGRNFYHYTDGVRDDLQPDALSLDDLDTDVYEEEDQEDEAEDEDGDVEKEDHEKEDGDLRSELVVYVPKDCWIKRMSAVEDGNEAYYLIAVVIDDNGTITSVKAVLEEVERSGSSLFSTPGSDMQGEKSYSLLEPIPDEVNKEIAFLLQSRALRENFTFVGKRLPQSMIDEGGNGGSKTNYTYALQSAYRMAYMHMSVETDDEGIIESLSYSSYQSNGSEWGDMFSRPHVISDRKDEAIDMLLYMIDLYSVDEYERLS